jgi:hypothetical protein
MWLMLLVVTTVLIFTHAVSSEALGVGVLVAGGLYVLISTHLMIEEDRSRQR